MKVAELQQFLSQIVPFVRAAKASEAVATELDRAVRCLEPFKDKSLVEFNDFLGLADEYVRTGVLPASAKPTKARPPRAPKAPKAPKLTVAEAAQIFQTLYERATDPTLEYSEIDAEISKFNDLKKDDLQKLAKEVNKTLPRSKMTNSEMVAAFKRMIKDQKENYERNQPTPPQAAAPASM